MLGTAAIYSAGGVWFLPGLRRLSPLSKKISEFSTSRSAIAVAIVVLNKMLPQSENGVFNAANIFMRAPSGESPEFIHFEGRSRRIKERVVSDAINLSVARNLPDFSFGAVTASSASRFTDGSARV